MVECLAWAQSNACPVICEAANIDVGWVWKGGSGVEGWKRVEGWERGRRMGQG